MKAYFKEDDCRKRRVRVFAIVVGIFLAIIAQVDSFALLDLPSPLWFGYPLLGWILSGLAASRGSAFWHDIIEIVRVIKETKQGVVEIQKEGVL